MHAPTSQRGNRLSRWHISSLKKQTYEGRGGVVAQLSEVLNVRPVLFGQGSDGCICQLSVCGSCTAFAASQAEHAHGRVACTSTSTRIGRGWVTYVLGTDVRAVQKLGERARENLELRVQTLRKRYLLAEVGRHATSRFQAGRGHRYRPRHKPRTRALHARACLHPSAAKLPGLMPCPR